jgi:hypothetical protein
VDLRELDDRRDLLLGHVALLEELDDALACA